MEALKVPLIQNEKVFMASLEIKEGPYRKARGAGVIGDVAVAAAGGAAGGAASYASWVLTLGVWEKALFMLGLANPPVGLVLGTATAFGAGALVCRKAGKYAREKAERGLYDKIPKALRTDPEELAEKVVEFAAASVKTGEYENVPAERVESVLCEKWGLDKRGVREIMTASSEKPIDETIKEMRMICRHNGLDLDGIIRAVRSDLQEAPGPDDLP